MTGRKYLEDPEEELSESTIPVQKIDMRAIINGKILSSTTIADGQLRNIYRKGTIPEEREGSNIVYISPSKHTESSVIETRYSFAASGLKYITFLPALSTVLHAVPKAGVLLSRQRERVTHPVRQNWQLTISSYIIFLPLRSLRTAPSP